MKKFIALLLLSVPASPLIAENAEVVEEAKSMESVVVEGRKVNLIGDAVSASEGVISQQELKLRPIARTGEVLELVPGMVVTQHSGTGKANQYFLRGFNLDHGTDFATFVDGMPVNMRTHGHGQGYTDLNFIIPETIDKITYKKGSYYADVGDFSGAGASQISTANHLATGKIELTAGQDSFTRVLFADELELDNAKAIVALENNRYDGPWTDIKEDLEKTNLLLKYVKPLDKSKLSISLMVYDNQWNSADQIPERAVSQGLIDQFGSLDTSVGGESHRYSLSANWQASNWQASAYLINQGLNLWSNFTYFLDDEDNGDQFEQVDERTIYGGQVRYNTVHEWQGRTVKNSFGSEIRIDDIDEVGLYKTQARDRLGAVRKDTVKENSLGLFWENRLVWTDRVKTILGARYDFYDFDVSDQAGININGVDLSNNGGSNDDSLFSLKGSFIYTLSDEWEAYLASGQSFHSNDARGTTITVDPSDGSQVEAVDPLVESFGYETGVRGFIGDKVNASASLWVLELDSELLFVGDAGNTEASLDSKRQGLELTTYYHFNQQLSFDVEYAYSDAKFTATAPGEGDEIPGAIEQVLQLGMNANFSDNWFGSLRFRYFGERPLTEDGSVKSDSTAIWNLRAGYQLNDLTLRADIINLTDSDDHDIDYFYESRLSGDPSGAGQEDVHFHVLEPRTVRLSASYQF